MSTLQEENFSESKEFALCCTKNIGDPQKSVDLPHTTDTTIPTAPLHSDSQPMSTEESDGTLIFGGDQFTTENSFELLDILNSISAGSTDQLLQDAENILAQFTSEARTSSTDLPVNTNDQNNLQMGSNSSHESSNLTMDITMNQENIHEQNIQNNSTAIAEQTIRMNSNREAALNEASQFLESLRTEDNNQESSIPENNVEQRAEEINLNDAIEICDISSINVVRRSDRRNRQQVASRSQETASANLLDDSVMIINDDNSSSSIPITPTSHSDDEVIFVEERPAVQRVTAVVDLCSSPDAEKLESSRKRKYPAAEAANTTKRYTEIVVEKNVAVSCPVCMEGITNQPPTSTICGHLFCYDCIKKAIQTRKKCPMCNTKLNLKQVHPIYLPV